MKAERLYRFRAQRLGISFFLRRHERDQARRLFVRRMERDLEVVFTDADVARAWAAPAQVSETIEADAGDAVFRGEVAIGAIIHYGSNPLTEKALADSILGALEGDPR